MYRLLVPREGRNHNKIINSFGSAQITRLSQDSEHVVICKHMYTTKILYKHKYTLTYYFKDKG